MRFEIDKQTLIDLDIITLNKSEKSIFSFFNYTKSIGGRERLYYFYLNPLSDIQLIESRIEIINYFKKSTFDLEINKQSLDIIECYLSQGNTVSSFLFFESILKALKNKFKPTNNYYIKLRAIRNLIYELNLIFDYFKRIEEDDLPKILLNYRDVIIDKITNSPLNIIFKYKNRKRIFPIENGKLNFLFCNEAMNEIRKILDIIYDIDAYNSLAFASVKHNFTLPEFTKEDNSYQINDLFHPFLTSPVTNNFEFINEKNICFLTGPNMAGKSTFLKSVGLSIYLSHLGFPVPAKKMRTSIFNGLLTTINLSDNLQKGYSHFYNEVLRVKYVAEKINQAGNIVVIFDELFRGTNVKDAYEASLSVISSFAKLNKGIFIISTHIIEVAENLKVSKSIFFRYFEANLIDDVPQYNYMIKEGITEERIGMSILKREKIIEIIESTIK